MNNNKPQTLKGFRDFLPETMTVRNYVKNLFIETFENFGFEPLETPTLEYASTLMGKYGDEGEKLVYMFDDKGGRRVGLRYDLTVPTAKVLAMYPEIPIPFKRYQLQNVWRADNTQKGRYREILQCDIDTFGTSSPVADAEIIAVIYTALKKLDFKKFSIRINSRTVLKNILLQSGITNNQNSTLQSLDKFQKIGEDGVRKELKEKDFSQLQIDSLFKYVKVAKPDKNLAAVFTAIKSFNLPDWCYAFDPTMVRGLDYYTGTIFETYVEEPKIGSITGGGRYDTLIKTLGGPDIPAVGTTLGLDRIVDCIIELNLLPKLAKTKVKIMVGNFGPETEKESLELTSLLRQNNIATIFYPDADKIGKQFKYASIKNIPFVALIGSDEAINKVVTLKDMTTGEQKTLTQNEIVKSMLK
ncbi:MAG: Histidyl-tRNA synthetase [Candidatus Shapirobacteria bacterium GW2011_GWE1_38_10]|uniref:Histidine--tRNA ligase n=1 Tax=Candidatus Shapirobacteria bacterium GW2011_GWE1_38_10 TaxID=1618488 RepID=A0A0G0I540_9BACT|nr:MAG: Histidyl-tRNA synthetase [Candidatus Shapirobacteria bacterium GW2011_GWF2_37_20]KKQ50458.1 MAG: Histidyl-tRNA synthetase [Candidatus Shapirobacteria bacterium GW2011_GWE1_38_10]KKQ65114.1 MAG: Histidyl-tRNA synthetase [Candidatus Shapirobacteria bacterium GW2011_GWF1_38_23]HBP50871.1 histidine--tRNA ligase [Candidatus Shapirobacteria bacterium]